MSAGGKKNKQRSHTVQASENAHRLRPTGLPLWAAHTPSKDGVDGLVVRPASRLQTPDAQGMVDLPCFFFYRLMLLLSTIVVT